MHFRPCIDIHNGKVKQIVGGSLTDQGNQAKENFTASENADYYAKMYQKDGLIGGHVILLNPVSSEYYRETKAQAILALVGKENVVIDLSCRKKEDGYYIVTDRWQKFTDVKLTQEVLREIAGYCDEYLVHGVDVEGKSAGIDEELAKILGEFDMIPVTYAGGIASLEDIEHFRKKTGGKVDFTIGSALDLFGGHLPYEQIKKY